MEKSDVQAMKLHANLGVCYLQTKEYKLAEEYFEKALKINKEDDITLTNIGILNSLQGNNKKAKKYLLKAKEHCQSPNQMNAIESWLKKVDTI